jgi:hypothetical protein
MSVYCMNLKNERYLRVNVLGPDPRLMKKRICRAAFSERLRNAALDRTLLHPVNNSFPFKEAKPTTKNKELS